MPKKILCVSTGWHNNCGVNSIAQFLARKIEDGEIPGRVANEPGYSELLWLFNDYYQLSGENRASWEDIRALLSKYPSPLDREILFSPVLRWQVARSVAFDPRVLLNESTAVLGDVVIAQGSAPSDITRPYYHSNRKFLDGLRFEYTERYSRIMEPALSKEEEAEAKRHFQKLCDKYQRDIDKIKKQTTKNTEALLRKQKNLEDAQKNMLRSEQLLEWVRFPQKIKLKEEMNARWNEHWNKQGHLLFMNYLGTLENNVMISHDHLTCLGKSLRINITTETASTILIGSKANALWDFGLVNKGLHYDFYEIDNDPVKAKSHNEHIRQYYGQDIPRNLPSGAPQLYPISQLRKTEPQIRLQIRKQISQAVKLQHQKKVLVEHTTPKKTRKNVSPPGLLKSLPPKKQKRVRINEALNETFEPNSTVAKKEPPKKGAQEKIKMVKSQPVKVVSPKHHQATMPVRPDPFLMSRIIRAPSSIKMLNQNNVSLEKIVADLSSKKAQFAIKNLRQASFSGVRDPGIAIEFDSPSKQETIGYIQEIQASDSQTDAQVSYALDNDLRDPARKQDFDFAAYQMFKIALVNATPDSVFDLGNVSSKEHARLEALFNTAKKDVLQEHTVSFTKDNAPGLVSTQPRQGKTLR